MDHLQYCPFGKDRRASGAKMQLHFATVGAFERMFDSPFKRPSASMAKRWRDEFDILLALAAHIAFGRCCAGGVTELTAFGKEKSQRRIQPLAGSGSKRSHS